MDRKILSFYGGADPRDMPIYGIAEAARSIKVSPSTLQWWVRGRKPSLPVIKLPDPDDSRLSFFNLVEAHILRALRRQHNLSLPKIRQAIDYVERTLDIERPLRNAKFRTDGVDIFVEYSKHFINATRSGQIAMRSLLEAHLQRVEYDEEGLASVIYPFIKDGDVSKLVSINPLISFGRPVIAGTRIPTEVLVERVNAGESVEEIARDYGQPPEAISEAIVYQQQAA